MNNKKQTEKEIYYKFANKMHALCYRYVGNREIAEELLNNGFIKVFKNLKKFIPQGENSFEYWVKKIMINECLMFLRKKNKNIFIPIEELLLENINNRDNNINIINEIVIDNEIDELIQKLPIGYKTIFNLYAIEGYSHKEISDKLNIQESTSRSQLTMARKQLKEMLIKKGLIYE